MEKTPNEKQKVRGKKRKRKDSDSSSSELEDVLPDNVLEVERNVVASAVKNNLDDASVKKILKKVVTNDHVLALVKLREEEESSVEENSLRPKLTRAKVKELMKVSPKAAPWNLENLELTPIKHIPVKTRPEVKALIAQELPEDEDDDEYEPAHDEVPSDDDQDMESCSDLDSQPRTPATPRSLKASPLVVKDGPFKVPQELSTPTRRKLNLEEEEATIALRTRSKLCLSETPIEHIESSFVPPDELPVPPVDDHLWNDFLNECLNPASVTRNEDDDETDPEYNVAADQDAHDEDEEALESTIIKISKKELNDLVTELFNIIPEGSVEEELTSMANSVLTDHTHNESSTRWEGKQEPLSEEDTPRKLSDRLSFERNNTKFSVGKTEPADPELDGIAAEAEKKNQSVGNTPPVVKTQPGVVSIAVQEQNYSVAPQPAPPAEPPAPLRLLPAPDNSVQVVINQESVILPEQIQILQQQLRQHIQLAASNFLQLYIHPLHWTKGPTYKEYLESLNKLVVGNTKSVANVCNLQPALQLVQTWENTVSKETPQNMEMVEYVLKESERWRRRSANNSLYIGQFHETFRRVIANSCVFLYPHLLPPGPYRADFARRYMYLPSEDELIVLGLDQFWEYVEKNPELFKPPKGVKGVRYGLTATLGLVHKHMFPWIPQTSLRQHVLVARRTGDKTNPIRKYFANREIAPVKHVLLPYNPALTLYEQPEHEMPRTWARYLAKTSKRFRGYLQQKSKLQPGAPTGVEVKLGLPTELPPKKPLPISFTKEVPRVRCFTVAKKPTLTDKIDVDIAKETTCNLFKAVQTSNGLVLVPLTNGDVEQVNKPNITNTVNCNTTPIISAVESLSNEKTKPKTDGHCKCCILLRKICKLRQTVITDFFRSKNIKEIHRCYCKETRYPRITNRLRLLINRAKTRAAYIYDDIVHKLKVLTKENGEDSDREAETSSQTSSGTENESDLAFVTTFQLKVMQRGALAKNILIKKKVDTILTSFDVNNGDPLKLAVDLEQAFQEDLVEMNNEFLGFLTPVQAKKMNKYREYFIQNYVEGLVKMIEEQVSDKDTKISLLSRLESFFAGQQWTACAMCSELLELMAPYPDLARHTYSLFVHDVKPPTIEAKEATQPATSPVPDALEEEPMEEDQGEEIAEEIAADSHAPVDYEADHSSSGEDNESETETESQPQKPPFDIKTEVTVTGESIDTPELTLSKTEVQEYCESSDQSMVIMSEDELVKPEPIEWKREEDKLILEVLKELLTPEEREVMTITEIIEERQIVELLMQSLTDKSALDIKTRILYILKLLVGS